MEFKNQVKVQDAVSAGVEINQKDQVKMSKFHWEAIMTRGDGRIERQEGWNQVQTLMLQHIADQMSDQGEAAMSHMAVGSGSGQAVGDTTLATELARVALTGTPSHAGAVISYQGVYPAGTGTGTITEAGVFNDPAAGTMGLYSDSILFAKGAADSLTLNWTLTPS